MYVLIFQAFTPKRHAPTLAPQSLFVHHSEVRSIQIPTEKTRRIMQEINKNDTMNISQEINKKFKNYYNDIYNNAKLTDVTIQFRKYFHTSIAIFIEIHTACACRSMLISKARPSLETS